MPIAKVDHLPSWLLSRANARSHALVQGAFDEVQLRPVHSRTLLALDEHGALSQADLGRHLGLDRKDVAVTLDLLTDRRLVRRRPDPADGRRNVVSLTEAGRKLVPELDRILADVQDQILAPLSSRERATLTDILFKMSGSDAG